MIMLFSLLLTAVVIANVVVVIAQHDTYDVSNLVLSPHDSSSADATYSCTFTSLWTSQRHPGTYPLDDAMWNTPLLATHNELYQIYSLGSVSSSAFERYVETGDYVELLMEILNGGENTGDIKMGRDMLADEESNVEGGYRSQSINDLVMTTQRSYLSGVASMYPASDWFTGFDSFDAIDPYSRRWYESFTIETYPCDAGTETGSAYHMGNAPESSKQPISALTIDTTPGSTGILLNQEESTVLPVASWYCQIAGVEYTDSNVDSNEVAYPAHIFTNDSNDFVTNESGFTNESNDFATNDSSDRGHNSVPVEEDVGMNTDSSENNQATELEIDDTTYHSNNGEMADSGMTTSELTEINNDVVIFNEQPAAGGAIGEVDFDAINDLVARGIPPPEMEGRVAGATNAITSSSTLAAMKTRTVAVTTVATILLHLLR